MPFTLFEWGSSELENEQRKNGAVSSIVSGIVSNNIDIPMQGKVLVHIPSLERDVWARLVATGAGNGRGFLFVPQPDDEVLVALNQDDPNNAFVLGGLWNNRDRMPETSPPEIVSKRTIKTGLVGGLGHTLEFDDLQQSITITSSTGQQITIDPLKIELKNTAGTLTITLDNASQSISITAAAKLELEALEKISLTSGQIELKGTKVDIQSIGPCSIQGLPVKIN
jgi:uncharacterized protein involved in type VI secretion and phage assembly